VVTWQRLWGLVLLVMIGVVVVIGPGRVPHLTLIVAVAFTSTVVVGLLEGIRVGIARGRDQGRRPK
jgi:hypothetical protein